MRTINKNYETLRKRLSFSKNLFFEWSFKIYKDRIEERDNFICWIRHNCNDATSEINICRRLLSEFPILHKLPAECILNLGIGIRTDRWKLYIHYIQPDGIERYMAFDGDQSQEYYFHYFPFTNEMKEPAHFVEDSLKPLFLTMSKEPLLQAMSGFWLKKQHCKVNQVCLSYPHRPLLRKFLPNLKSWTITNLSSYEQLSIKHLAFNADKSLTIYVQARFPFFPVDVKAAKTQVTAKAEVTRQRAESFLHGLTLSPRPLNQFMEDFYTPANLSAWRKLLGKGMFYHFGLFDVKDDPSDIWNDRPFQRATEDLCRHISSRERVYELGCGYGGVLKYLHTDRQCSILGATISKLQFQYCNQIRVPCRYTDMEASLPPGFFDTILMFESLEHVNNKFALLKKLRRFTQKLVIRINTQESLGQNRVFGDSMKVVSSLCLEDMLHECGYQIVYFEDKRLKSLPTINIWKARLHAVPIENDPHYNAWKQYVQRVSADLETWSNQHKLLDIVAV